MFGYAFVIKETEVIKLDILYAYIPVISKTIRFRHKYDMWRYLIVFSPNQ